jgi:eukaryotic-like serine/threonine-protein kinase
MTPSPTRFGRYQLIEPLGKGGMAQVWRARLEGSEGFSRDLVIKRILDDRRRDPLFASMFAREAKVLAMLRHANIIQVFDFGDVDGEPYLAMEYVDGVDVRRLLGDLAQRGERVPPGICAFIAREVLRALKHMHDAVDEAGKPLGLVHRDISPSNVLLGLDGSVKLLDFGIAKAAHDRSLTETGGFRGKIPYSAPEVVDGQAHEARSDLFALGVVLHELLTARKLFDAPSDIQTLGLVRAAAVRAPSELAPGVPATLDAICLKAVARLPGDRFESAQAMLSAIDPVVHELQTGPEQLAALVTKAAAARPASSHSVPVKLPKQPAARGASRMLGVGIAALVLSMSVGAGILALRKQPEPVAAEPPASVPPAPGPAPAEPPPPQVVGAEPEKAASPNPLAAPAKPRPLKRPVRKKAGANVPNLEEGNVVDPFPTH